MEINKGFVFFKKFYSTVGLFFADDSQYDKSRKNAIDVVFPDGLEREAPHFSNIQTLNPEEAVRVSQILKSAFFSYLLKKENFAQEFIPLREKGKVKDIWIFEMEKKLKWRKALVDFLYFWLYSLLYTWESKNIELPENLSFWEKAILYYHIKSPTLLKKIKKLNLIPLYPFFTLTKELPVKTTDSSLLTNDEILLLFIFKRKFYKIFEKRILELFSLSYSSSHESSFLSLMDELERYSSLLNSLYKRLENENRYELMGFFLIFYHMFDYKIVEKKQMEISSYKMKNQFYQQLNEIFTPLENILNIRIKPLGEEAQNSKKYLFSALNPLRETLSEKLIRIRSLIGV